LINEIEGDIGWIESRYEEKRDIYIDHGFDDSKLTRLIELMHRKLEYVKDNFENDSSFEWTGGFNFIVTGVKQ
jgi:folate-dependent tRNA-U54 methylase TrmFO/GidA